MAQIIDGKAIAAKVRQEVSQAVESLKERGVEIGLHVVLVGDDPASHVYVRNKERAAAEVGILSTTHRLPQDATESEVLTLLASLNSHAGVDGVLVQLPVPPHIDTNRITDAQDPARDVDGFHPVNLGMLVSDRPGLLACTPAGCLRLIDETGTDLKGKRAVVVGRSLIVGKPMAHLLLQRHATVTVCHSRTQDLPARIAEADVLVAAIGRADMIQGDWIKEGAVVIDVGMNRNAQGKLTGDVDFESASKKASFITPVPGGVGPMTIAYLMRNTVIAACARRGLPFPF
ncbi:MAG: bifunctional methylenetetrahydrofolate dehydrogenase/methenyltetrahydrofolate cyclohydrolase FolD [Myxococcota bacterium]|jgi:methylenetetrahydrofolate dehydrogenase (NADP+)/methenyltetrahydrofolate cyclohydrolase|nr:bifunctional methylenetetrahydrofolate dehydrogenase/methenyltetrahydrofolate cyclohydrolase FolD [Myxococcota bacterium]OQC41546.1 MAG: Bifunctional protein FolD protein [Deltaproteobacteria bacterium ADurb.Bin058]MBP8971696.1 bifunctional methylenetetrahydrofolate dehydrogenase/methenyltetrahydrofolate cyclohydrolase FolD [Myxococcota bacterium]HOE82981.1 bifunctional methylenetetrahydrofolate dehydrogenase/methenyltetrahydrofolate cyclohydrolase FolD [Myxococcota bacterium]HON26271.1 bifu